MGRRRKEEDGKHLLYGFLTCEGNDEVRPSHEGHAVDPYERRRHGPLDEYARR